MTPDVVPSHVAREFLRGVAAAILAESERPRPPAGSIRIADLEAAKTEMIEMLAERFALIPAGISADATIQSRVRHELDEVLTRMVARSAAARPIQ